MPEIKKIHCNTCNYETKHELIASHDRSYCEVEEHYGRQFAGWHEDWIYRFFVCRGCDTGIIEEKYTCAGMHDYDGNEIYSYEYFPERRNDGKREPKRFSHIDKKLNDAYKEIIKSYQHGLKIVTAMGVRALLEGICIIEGVDDTKAWGLNKKIEELQTSSNIPDSIVEGLKGIKFIGDNAAHRLNTSDKSSIGLAIDLLEVLLTHLYEAKFDLQHKADLVKKAHSKKMKPKSDGIS